MGILRGLKEMNRAMESPVHGDGVKGRWVKLEDGQSVKIRVLQELDADSATYDSVYGLAIMAVEHTNPTDYRRKALCSIDDQGRCYGCEQHRRNPKAGWKGKTRLYANVLVDDGKEDPYVAILSQGFGPKSVTPTLIEYAGETGSVSNIVWKLKRIGKGTETAYNIIPLPSAEMAIPDNVELFELEKTAVRDITYEEQEGFYVGVSDPSTPSTATSASEEW
jgi:hypothetical protein